MASTSTSSSSFHVGTSTYTSTFQSQSQLAEEDLSQTVRSHAPFTRLSRLPPTLTVPSAHQGAGPSCGFGPQRYLYFAIRRGHRSGVYVDWFDAEKQLINYPDPSVKTFSTRLAAEAFVAGWDGAGRHSLPPTTPKPLREHLAMSFPGSVNVPYSAPRRQSYHARLLASAPPPSAEETDFGAFVENLEITTTKDNRTRPSSGSFRHSMVKVSSPLRQEVDDDAVEELDNRSSRLPPLRKAASFVGMGGLLSPPTSPEDATKRLSVMDRERPTKARGISETGPWASRGHRDFASGSGLGLVSPPTSPPASAVDKRMSINGKSVRQPARASGLWADAVPTPPVAPPSKTSNIPGAELFGDNTAPKFSRSSLRKSGVVMPVAAKRTSSSNSLRSIPSRTSLLSPSANSSSSSLSSTSSRNSEKTVRRLSSQPSHSQDRLSTLAETSRRELQLNDERLSALDSLSPPRPAFMKRSPSSSSIGSNSSIDSMGSMTSGSSAQTSSFDSCEPIFEENEVDVDVVISCTKSDGDADGSVDSGSMKDVRQSKKGPGGMFKRFAKALKMEKKSDALRRGSM